MKTFALILAAVLVSAVPLEASAHAFLEKASPAAGENVPSGRLTLQLHFSEALEATFSDVKVVDAAGHDMAAGPAKATDSQMVLPLKPLQPGRYRVSWHAVSTDTHRTEGAYSFTVATGAAPPSTAPAIIVSDAWLRALPAGLPDAGYFTLKNPTPKTVTLNGASSPSCGMLMLHKSDTMSGMSSMSDVESIDILPGATAKFAPGGYHLMCTTPAGSIKPGGKVMVQFEFADGTKLPVAFDVRGANGK